MDLYALNTIQLKSVIAHEFGHIKHKDTLVSIILSHALTTLYDWTDMNNMGLLIEIVFFPMLILLSLYFRLLVFVTRWAMRRQEYSAEYLAAQIYGKSIMLQALISTGAIGSAFGKYIPDMMQNIDNDIDRRDFYSQFLDYWEHLPVINRQKYCAIAVASLSSVYDTHPSYQARRKALEKLDNPPAVETDNRPCVFLIPNVEHMGRELTIRMIKKARS
jgi:Zn-dependent protease with chaperone function